MQDLGKILNEWRRAAFRYGQRKAKIVVPALTLLGAIPPSYYIYQNTTTPPPVELAMSELENDTTLKNVESLVFVPREKEIHIEGKLRNTAPHASKAFESSIPHFALPEVTAKLRENNVKFSTKVEGWEFNPTRDGLNVLSMVTFLVVASIIYGKTKNQYGLKKKGIRYDRRTHVTFKDVAGIDESKAELEEVVEFLKNPEKFTKLGGRIPKGVLLDGGPGVGKTLLARAVAGEAGVPFYSISGSDFVDKFVGNGASRVRELFDMAKEETPCIIFVDEIDAVGKKRNSNAGQGSNDEREQTLNQLLVEMDGLEGDSGIIIVAATNRPDALDDALVRPGRFDRKVTVPNPDVNGREQILKVHTRKIPLAGGVDLRAVAKSTPGFSGADLMNLANEAALHAARLKKIAIDQDDFDSAKDKIIMGPERKSAVISDEEKKLTAYHEGGHALISLYHPQALKLNKATIIPRGGTLGSTHLEHRDKNSATKEEIEAILVGLAGGRAAERVVFGDKGITNVALSDIQEMTRLALRMVREFGMSDLGEISLTEESGLLSDAVTLQIKEEAAKIVRHAMDTATAIITDHRDELEVIAQALLEHETLSADEIKTEIAQRPVPAVWLEKRLAPLQA